MSETHLGLLMNMPYLSMNFLALLEHNKKKKFSKKHYKSIILTFINSYNFDNMNIDKSRLIEIVNKYGDFLIKSGSNTLGAKYNKLTEQLNNQKGGSNQLVSNNVWWASGLHGTKRAITNWLPGEEAIFSHVIESSRLEKMQIILTNYGRNILVDLPRMWETDYKWKYHKNYELIEEKTDVLKLGGKPINLNKLEIDMIKTLSKNDQDWEYNEDYYYYLMKTQLPKDLWTNDPHDGPAQQKRNKIPIDWVVQRDGIGYTKFSIYLIDRGDDIFPDYLTTQSILKVATRGTFPQHRFYYSRAFYKIQLILNEISMCPDYQPNCESRAASFVPKKIAPTQVPTITPPNNSCIDSNIPRLNTQLLDNNYSNRSQDFMYIQITMIFVVCLFIFYNKEKIFKKIKSLLITEIETREAWASRITEKYRPTSINNNLHSINLHSNNLELRRYGPETISDDLELGEDYENKNITYTKPIPNSTYYTDTSRYEYTSSRSKKKNLNNNNNNRSLKNNNNFNNLL